MGCPAKKNPVFIREKKNLIVGTLFLFFLFVVAVFSCLFPVYVCISALCNSHATGFLFTGYRFGSPNEDCYHVTNLYLIQSCGFDTISKEALGAGQ